MQQAVFQPRAFNLNVVGELEAAFEGAAGDALEQEAAFRLFRLGALAGDGQDAFLNVDGEIALTEAGDRHGDAVFVLGRCSML